MTRPTRRPEDEFVFDEAELEPAAPDDDTAVGAGGTADADGGVGDTADPDGSPSSTASSTSPARDTPRAGARWLLPALLFLLAAALVAAGVVFVVRDPSGAGGDNQAVVDGPATTQVIGEVSQGLNQVLSYDYQQPQTTEQAAAAVLVGDAATQYRTLFTTLQSKAPGQQLTLTANTVNAAVSRLSGDTAQLLVFVNQSTTRASDGQTSSSAAELQITAVRSGDRWKISELVPI